MITKQKLLKEIKIDFLCLLIAGTFSGFLHMSSQKQINKEEKLMRRWSSQRPGCIELTVKQAELLPREVINDPTNQKLKEYFWVESYREGTENSYWVKLAPELQRDIYCHTP